MARIVAKQHEHEVHKLGTDPHDLMETAVQKWTKVVDAVAKTGCSVYPRAIGACRDKWQTLLADYKKISTTTSALGATKTTSEWVRNGERNWGSLATSA
jgi:hypothetical protein